MTMKWALSCFLVAVLAATSLVRLSLSRSSDALVVVSLGPNATLPRELAKPETRIATPGGTPETAQRERPLHNVAHDPQLGALNWTSPDKGAIVFCTPPRRALAFLFSIARPRWTRIRVARSSG